MNENCKDKKPTIVVTMATSRQGSSVVRHLSKTNNYKVRAICRNIYSDSAKKITRLPNVELVEGDLLDKECLIKNFKGAYGIFGNTTPTTGWKIFKGSMNSEYELKQGQNLIEAVEEANNIGFIKHFVFSSICKAKDPLKNYPAPRHFINKWDIEELIKKRFLSPITTIIRPVSYFENFETNLPGLNISGSIFPGLLNPYTPWQTIAVDDIGLWTSAIFQNKKKFIGESINLATEELSGIKMASILQGIVEKESNVIINYKKIPRSILSLLEYDIAVMSDWIERTGYGADIPKLKDLASNLGLKLTTLSSWLKEKNITTNYKLKVNTII